MELIFNELSACKISSSKDASKIYKIFFELVIIALKNKCPYDLTDKITSIGSLFLKEVVLHNGLSFISWISKLPLSRITEKRIFLRLLTVYSNPINYPEYNFKNKQALGLGYAFEKNLISISFNTSEIWNKHSLTITKHHINSNDVIVETPVIVNNICINEHLLKHKRIFKHSKKHNINNPRKKESPLFYNPKNKTDIKKIQELLNCSIPTKKNSKRLCFYDKHWDMYIIFQRESKKKGHYSNVFHAFHVPKGTNIISNNVKKQIQSLIS